MLRLYNYESLNNLFYQVVSQIQAVFFEKEINKPYC